MAAPKHTALHNLTIASAKHLLQQGHISPAHHSKILKKVKAAPPGLPAPGQAPMMKMADEAPAGAFGSLHPVQGAGAGHYMSTMQGGQTPSDEV